MDDTQSGPPFTLLPGAADAPVLLHVPHAARTVQAVRGGIVLDDAALARESDHMVDAHTDVLAARAAAAARRTPWRFVNRLSRLVVDPERFPDAREEMRKVGMGAVYTRTSDRLPLRAPDFDERPLLDRYFHPYAHAMTEAVRERLAAAGRAAILDVHSYPTHRLPYELHGEGPRPPVCLGADPFHTPPELLARAESAFARCGTTGRNSPFAGAYVPLEFYGSEPRVTALMLEIRRDLYMEEPGGPAGPGLDLLAEALTELVDSLAE
ncbi:N-formylglutamate amidohydrolase [Streptomyces cavernicola]|uniref:N-formylglutamate amidohydrolase n=1 Tax=Streptomyces cavernicola TaxID=3043613 RepID=A0ABT6SER9_9ACTN|nr:N-formylglutamate amidohydrolase [Streptomyces sp. B-S-A6]MDI3406663.1 N-formylglutamate amidohydrolase [Streptomyces sp. B-S-A6]